MKLVETGRPTFQPVPMNNVYGGSNNNNNNNNGPLYNTVATCGGGNVGNGLCSQINECCSTFGYCGTSASHCSNQAPVSNNAVGGNNYNTDGNSSNNNNGQATTAAMAGGAAVEQGTCGGGSVGNNICPNSSDCCSQYGFCGTTLEHCLGKQSSANTGSAGSTTGAVVSNNGNVNNFNQGGGQIMIQNQPQQQQYYDGTNTVVNSRPTVDTINNVQYGGNHPEPQQQQQQSTTSLPHGTNKKIIGYYAGWQWYDRNKLADPKNIDFRKMQRVNYAFFQLDLQGQIYGIDYWGDPQVLFGPYSTMLGGGIQKCSYDGPHVVNCGYHEYNEGLIYRAHQVGTEVYPSIGGW